MASPSDRIDNELISIRRALAIGMAEPLLRFENLAKRPRMRRIGRQACLIVSATLSLLWSGIAWAAGEDLRLLTSEEPPTNYTLDGQVTGLTTDIVREMERRLAISLPIEVRPWARSYQEALSKPNIAIFTIRNTPEREKLGFEFVGPVTTRQTIVFKRVDTGRRINSIADIKTQGLTVGVMRGDWRAAYLKDQGVEVEENSTHDLTIKQLMGNRFPLFVLSDLELGMVMSTAGVPIDRVSPAVVVMETKGYIAFSKGTSPETVTRWKLVFAEIQKDPIFTRDLAAKWSSTMQLPISFSVDKGFFISGQK